MDKEDKGLSDITKKLQASIEEQTGDFIFDTTSDNSKFKDKFDLIKKNILYSIEKATSGGNLELDIDKKISLSSFMGDVSDDYSDSSKFSKKLDLIKSNTLNSIQKATSGGKLKVKLDKSITLSDLMGDVSSDNEKHAFQLDLIKSNTLDSIRKATSGGNLELDIDKKISLSDLMGDTKSLDNLNIVLGYQFYKVKKNILNLTEAATKSIKKVNLSDLSLSSILGESPKLNIIHALRWLRIKKNILEKVEKKTENVELEIDNKMSLSSILGSSPDQDIITRTRFFLIRQRLLNKFSKAAKDFDPQQSIDSMTGNLGRTGGALDVAGGDISNREIPNLLESISENIISSSESLKTLVENSSGNILQERENRKEDIARQERQIEALNSISDNNQNDSSKSEKSGGILNSIKESLTSKIGLGGKGVGGGIGGVMSGIGKGAGKGLEGFLTGLGKGLKSISNPKYLIGAGVLIALGGALLVTGKSLKEFTGIDFKQVALGVTTLGLLGAGAALLGKLGPQILIGSLAIAALGASLIPAAFAFNMFSDVNWKGVAIGIGTLTLLGAAAFGLSFISPAIFIGAAAIAALGASMIPAALSFSIFSKALSTLTPFIEGFGNAISTVIGSVGSFLTGFIDSLVQLSGSGLGLITAGTGIAAVSAALIAFGSSSAIGGLLSFFGGDPIEKFLELADKSSGLDASSKAINSIASSLEKLDSDKIDDMTDSLKGFVGQLKNLSKLKLKEASTMFKFMAEVKGSIVSGENQPNTGDQTEVGILSPASRNNTGAQMEVGMSNIADSKTQGAPVIVAGGGGGAAPQNTTVNASNVNVSNSRHAEESWSLTTAAYGFQ